MTKKNETTYSAEVVTLPSCQACSFPVQGRGQCPVMLWEEVKTGVDLGRLPSGQLRSYYCLDLFRYYSQWCLVPVCVSDLLFPKRHTGVLNFQRPLPIFSSGFVYSWQPLQSRFDKISAEAGARWTELALRLKN